MKPKRLVVLRSLEAHFWTSCNVIEEHITRALDASTLDPKYLEIDGELSPEQLTWLSENSENELSLLFLSDIISYQKIIGQIDALKIRDLRYLLPVYGNMTMEIFRWLAIDQVLRGQKVILLGASPRSCQQLQLFVKQASIFYLPFCFESVDDFLEPSTETIDLVYAGRITPQKNILELLTAFHKAQEYNPKLRLHLGGDFHDRMYHLHGYRIDFEVFKQEFHRLVNHPSIKFHGNLSQEELLKLFRKSSYFISMSTYHDEDFGMSACQAASFGLPLILSDWGGHGAFRSHATFVPVAVDAQSVPRISTTHPFKLLAGLSHPATRNSELPRLFSYRAYAEKLERLMSLEPIPYQGQSELYHEYARRGLKAYPFANRNADDSERRFYLSIYQAYLEDGPGQEKFKL